MPNDPTVNPGTQHLGEIATALEALAPARESVSASTPKQLATDTAAVLRQYGSIGPDNAWLGLVNVCQMLAAILEAAVVDEETAATVDEQVSLVTSEWPDLLRRYSADPGSYMVSAAMVEFVRRSCWGNNVNLQEAVDLLDALVDVPPHVSEHATSDMYFDPVSEAIDDESLDIFDEPPLEDESMSLENAESNMLLPTEESVPLSGSDNQPLSDTVKELLDILIDELPQIDVAIEEMLGLMAASEVETAVHHEAACTTGELFERLGSASDTMSLAGLADASRIAAQQVQALTQDDPNLSPSQVEAWQSLVPAFRVYLQRPCDTESIAMLVTSLVNEQLPILVDRSKADALSASLANLDFASVEGELGSRIENATKEHVSLAVPDDVSQELLDGLLQEMPQYAEEFSLAIQRMLIGGTLEDVLVAQRVAHTLKGAGNTVGVRGVAELTHHLEDVLIALAKHEVMPTKSLAESMMTASDCIESMAEFLQGSGPEPADSILVLQQILDWANLIDRDGPPLADSESTASVATTAQSESAASTAVLTNDKERDAARENNAMLRVPSRLVDELLRIVGESIIVNSQLNEHVRNGREKAAAMTAQLETVQQLGTELEEFVDVKDLTANTARSDDSEFDDLEMDKYNELHTYSRRMIEAAIDAREIGRTVVDELVELDDMLIDQARLNRETQDGVLETRMVPVNSVFARLQRSVRQTCRLADKQVDLKLVGGDTLMDSEVLMEIVDPLMHLLRNSVDHGIEQSDERLAANKDATGRLELEFSRDGNNVLVRCRDDGAGLDYDAIRLAGEAAGLIEPEAEVSDDELKRLVLQPNFTTREKATQISGRGIGLDAVYGRVSDLGGTVQIESSHGAGCEIEIRLPVTLLSTHALLVSAHDEFYALASRGIRQIVHIDEGDIRNFGSELVFQFGENVHRARQFDSVVGIGTEVTENTTEPRSAVLVDIDGEVEAVLVESVIGGRELVVKTLGEYLPKLTGIVGATILGDGNVSPVIDLVDMLRAPIAANVSRVTGDGSASFEESGKPTALVVDDSLSARKALAQLLSDSGFAVSTAQDGMEAVEILAEAIPDIVFVDMEMPRMNGIELTSHIRASDRMAHIPIVMVTSRSTAKHRSQAKNAGVNAYVTKPFVDDLLIEQAHELTAAA